MRKLCTAIVGLLCTGLASITAAEPYVVKEINAAGAAIAPGGMTGNTFVFAFSGAEGEELYASDGTTAGTRLLRDINPGGGSSAPSNFATLGDGRVAFAASDGTTGAEPWISDGTLSGTMRMADVRTGATGSNPHSFLLASGAVYFIADDGSNGAELWRWDGNAANRVSQLGSGANDGFNTANSGDALNLPRGVFNGKAVYASEQSFAQGQVIIADGSGVTTIADDIRIPGQSSGRVSPEQHFLQVGNRLLFIGRAGALDNIFDNATNLYASNGTANSVTLLKEGSPTNLTLMDGTAYFACQPGDTRQYGNANNVRGLWETDGTSAGTQVVTEAINPSYGFYGPQSLFAIGSTLYFSAQDSAFKHHVWRSDGTAAGTTKIDHDFQSTRTGDTQPIAGLTNVGGELWFLAGNNTIGRELWRLSGNSLTMFDEMLPGNTMLELPGDTLPTFGGSGQAFFIARDAAERLVLYGVVRGSSTVETLAVPSVGPGDAEIMSITKTTDGVIFRADEATEGERIWFSDGTEAGTIPIYDPKPGIDGQVGTQENQMIRDAVQIDRRLFVFIDDGLWPFSTANDLPIGTEPFSVDLDSPEKNTELIVDTVPGFDIIGTRDLKYKQGKELAAPRDSVVFGPYVYFRATDIGGVGMELYRSNAVDSVELVADINPGPENSYPREMTPLNGRLIFHADTEAPFGQELWAYDPGLETVAMIKDINPGNGSVFGDRPYVINFGKRRLIPSGNYIYFPGDNGTDGTELWRTDGTEAGTAMVADINPNGNGLDWSIPREAWAGGLNNGIVFMADDGVHGNEPWIFDGNQARMLADLNPGSEGSFPDEFVSIGSWCYFAADDGTYGLELWRTNGVLTERLSDGDPGDRDLDPVGLTKVGKSLVFIGHDGADSLFDGSANPELWEYDGVSVRKVWESLPGDKGLGIGNTEVFQAVSPPDEWVAVGNKLFFTTKQDAARGRELWVYETNGQLGGSSGQIDLPAGDLRVDEGDGSLETQIYVARSGGEDGPVSVRVRSIDGSASATTHYEAIDQVLTWADGDTSLKSVTITTYGDTVFTQDRDFTLELSDPAGGVSLGIASQRIIITEDDPPPSAGALRFANASLQVVEGDSGSTDIIINVTREDGSAGAVSVDYTTSDSSASAGSDYVAASGTLTWADGDSVNKSFTVTINGDTLREGDETLTLTLTNATGGAAIAQGTSAIVILTDEGTLRQVTFTVQGLTTSIEAVQGLSTAYEGTAGTHEIDGNLNRAGGELLDNGLKIDQDTQVTIIGDGNG